MKKNIMMRLASFLLVAVLISTSAISGTYAKYVTSGKSGDEARVAKWGVTIKGASDMFQKEYDKTDNTFTLADKTVVSNADAFGKDDTRDDVVAPGTNGKLTDFSVTGVPEVAVRISYDVKSFDLRNWKIDEDVEYCPIIFTINGVNYYIGKTVGGNVIDTVDKLEEAMIAAIEYVTNDYAANTDLSEVNDDLQISWMWAFEGKDFPIAGYQTDENDTALGNWDLNKVSPPIIDFETEITVTQID